MESDQLPAQRVKDARTEQIVLRIGMLLSYGATTVSAAFLSILAVGGGGEATGVYVVASTFGATTLACFALSLHFARQRKHVRAIFLGFVPIPLVLSIAYAAYALYSVIRGE